MLIFTISIQIIPLNFENINNCKQWLDTLEIEQGMWFAAPREM